MFNFAWLEVFKFRLNMQQAGSSMRHKYQEAAVLYGFHLFATSRTCSFVSASGTNILTAAVQCHYTEDIRPQQTEDHQHLCCPWSNSLETDEVLVNFGIGHFIPIRRENLQGLCDSKDVSRFGFAKSAACDFSVSKTRNL